MLAGKYSGKGIMSINNLSPVVECIACGWQGREHDTDSRSCPECDGECMELEAIYGPKGVFADTTADD